MGNHAHHNMDGGSHQHHSDGMMEDNEISNDMSTILSDPIHHHLAESAGESHMMMQMFFHGGCDEVILFDWWRISTYSGLIASMLACAVLAILYEGLKVFREHVIWSQNRKQQRLQQKRYNSNSRSLSTNSNAEGIPNSAPSNGVNDSFEGDTEIDMIEDGGSSSSAVISEQAMGRKAPNAMFNWGHLLGTILHLVQMSLAYILMLIVMTFNTWLCLAVVLGSTLGYFLIGWKRPAGAIDVSDHCH